jgi:hypothetical protein
MERQGFDLRQQIFRTSKECEHQRLQDRGGELPEGGLLVILTRLVDGWEGCLGDGTQDGLAAWHGELAEKIDDGCQYFEDDC